MRDGCRVITPNHVCPDLVDPSKWGHHTSQVIQGERHWLFDTPEAAKQFEYAQAYGAFRRRGLWSAMNTRAGSLRK